MTETESRPAIAPGSGLVPPQAVEAERSVLASMLLGNEAFADALDPTIGLDGIPSEDLGDQFSFKGVRGIDDLHRILGEEEIGSPKTLAVLRGKDRVEIEIVIAEHAA